MPEPLSVLIVGAGPVGLTFAAEMARYGMTCRIVDKASGTKEISKALILHVRTQEVLDCMGITHAFQDLAVPMRRVEIIGYGKHLGHGTMEGINSPHPYPIILGQNVTEHILHDHVSAAGIRVEWNTEATTLAADSDGVTATLRLPSGEMQTVRSQYVLGADGTHSITREQAGILFQGNRYEGQAFIQSDSKIRWSLPAGSSYLWFTEKGYMMVIQMPNDIVRTFISVPDPGPGNTTTLEEVNRTLNELGGVDAELYDPSWVSLYRVNHRAASVFRKGRIFIAGDAAHEHVPIGGQGMNTSIQDAFNLAWKLAYVIHGWAKTEILDTYQVERHPVAESLLKGTDEAYTKLLKAGDWGRAAVGLVGPLLLSNSAVREKMRDTLEEININYRNGPLTEEHGGSDGPKAGDRMLDGPVVKSSSKETVDLREVLRGIRWSVLLFSGTNADEKTLAQLVAVQRRIHDEFEKTVAAFVIAHGFPVSKMPDVLLDSMSHLHDQYGVKELCLYAIRPDCYVGFRGGIEHADDLISYLSRILD